MLAPKSYQSLRKARSRQSQGPTWPVNEILLQSLVISGKSDHQIAELCGVEPEQVTQLRQQYDI
jgi:hypothetical protein